MAEKNIKKKLKRNEIELILMASISVVFLAIFAYLPMFGIVLAFKDGDNKLNILSAIFNSRWVGFDNFKAFLNDPHFVEVILNTLGLNLTMLLINFPLPIIFALLINEVRHVTFRKSVQTIANLPHFLSWIVFGGLVIAMTDRSTGVITEVLNILGVSDPYDPINLMDAQYFWGVMIISSAIKGIGWGSIVYVAAISSIPQDFYESADIDGANRFQKCIFITVPSIAGTITVFLLLRISDLLTNSFEQFHSLQNVNNIDKSEVIATYVYKMGISYHRYSYTSAMSLFNSIISVILLLSADFLSRKLTERGLFTND